MKLKFKILDSRIGSNFPIPKHQTSGSAGIDLIACIDDEMILDHFYPVFKYLDPNDYDLIFLNDVKEKKINKKFFINNNFKFLKTWSSYWKKNKYKISISNLYIDGSRLNKNYFYLFIKKLILKLDNIFSKKIFKDTSFRNFILNQEIYFPLKVGRINIRFLYGIWFDSFQIGKFNNLYLFISKYLMIL